MKKPGNAREDRGVHHAQPFGTVNAEIAAEHPTGLARPDGAGAGGVMAPCDTAHEIHQLLIAPKRITGLLLGSNQSALLELCGQLANKANSGDDRLQILSSGIAALIEIVEIYERGVARIG
jgi:hypothetical protein